MSSSSEPSSPSSKHNAPAASNEVSRLKRQLVAVQDELKEISCMKAKKAPTTVTMGRGIRRLVTLIDSLEDLTEEADKHYRIHDDQEPEDDSGFPDDEFYERERESQRKLSAYTLLLQQVPQLKMKIEDTEITEKEFSDFLGQLQKGANDARSDDIRRIKEEVALWLNYQHSPKPPLLVKSRSDRGLQNDITGRLICPIDYDWDNEHIRNELRAGFIDISEDYFLRCLYPHGNGDPDNVEKGFLRSALLVKTFCAIFTSPSSSESFESEDEDGPARKKQRTNAAKKATKGNVASILHMDGKVTPRAIAYAAVLLVFNLSDATHWTEVYNQFNYRALYILIVDFFEEYMGPLSSKRAKDLLKWWDNQVFPNYIGASTKSRKSRNKLNAQRHAREESVEV